MAIKFREELRDARLNAFETFFGTTGADATACIQIYTGTTASACSAANPAGLLVEFNLPADFMAAATGGSKAISGSANWSATATASGTAASFRIFKAYVSGTRDNTTCQMQGTVGQGTGDLSFDNNVFATGQTIQISTFTLTDGNG